jgi:hypothetical protein
LGAKGMIEIKIKELEIGGDLKKVFDVMNSSNDQNVSIALNLLSSQFKLSIGAIAYLYVNRSEKIKKIMFNQDFSKERKFKLTVGICTIVVVKAKQDYISKEWSYKITLFKTSDLEEKELEAKPILNELVPYSHCIIPSQFIHEAIRLNVEN